MFTKIPLFIYYVYEMGRMVGDVWTPRAWVCLSGLSRAMIDLNAR